MKSAGKRLPRFERNDSSRSKKLFSFDELINFLENAGLALHRLAPDGTILWANAAELRLLGYDHDEYVGHNIGEFHADAAVAEDILRRLGEGSALHDYEARLRTKEGSIRYVSITSHVHHEGKQSVHTWCLRRDITEKKRVTELQQLLAAIVESSDDAIVSKDLNGIIRSWNRGAERIFGYTAEEIIGKPVTVLAAPDVVDEIPQILARIRRGERIDHYETKRQTKDGRILAVSLTVSPIRDASGTIIGASKIARDVTERKRSTEVQERFAAIVESSDDAIISKDLNGIIRSWNRGAERIFGYTADEVIGKPVTILAAPTRVDEMPNILARIRRGERVDHFQTERQTKDGKVLTISLTVSPMRDANGAIIGASKIARDVTAAKRAEEAQRQLERQLMLLIEASGTLLASPHSADVIQRILDTATRFIVADAYAVWRRSGEIWTLIMSKGLSDEYERTASDERLASGQRLGSDPIAIEDVEASPLVRHRLPYYRNEGIRSMLTVPLNIHGEMGGTLVFYKRIPHCFTAEEVRLGTALGNLAAAALGTAELYDLQLELRAEAERARRQASFLAEAGGSLSSSLDYTFTLQQVAQAAVPVFADWCTVDIEVNGQLERVALAHQDATKVESAREFRRKYPPRDTDPTLTAMRTGQSILVEQLADEVIVQGARSEKHLDDIRTLGIQSYIVVPMLARGRARGTLTFVTAESGRRYTNADLAFAEELARRAATAIDNAQLYAGLQESESSFRQLANAVPAFVWVMEPDGRAIYVNERWYDYTGLTEEQSLGFGWAKTVHPEDVARVLASWKDSTERQTAYSAECRYGKADGTYRWFLMRALPVRDEAGRILKWFGTSTDVHDAKEARETAELLNRVGPVLAAELDSEKLTQSITDIATRLAGAEFGALFHNMVDEKGESYVLYTLSGVEREAFAEFPMPRNTEVFGPTFRGERIVRSEDITKDPRYGRNAPYQGMPKGHLPVRSYLAVPVVSRFGEVLAGLFFGHSEPGRFTEWHERIAGGIAAQAAIALDNARLFRDVQVARESAEQSNDELRRANADLEQFAYSASHDLKEPLRMMGIYSQMLQRRYREKLDSAGEEYLRYIVGGAQRMEELVRDLLAYTRAVSVSGPRALSPVDANAALSKSLIALKHAIDESAAIIEHRNLPDLLVTEVHLTQLFQNLIENAIKYRGTGSPRIMIDAERDGELWKLCVRDNGIGIPKQYAEQVFGIFKRLHTNDKYSGTGIGLAICQRIVNRYGGSIWVESEGEGLGSTFCFTLPGTEAGSS